MNFCGLLTVCPQKVRRMEVVRLVGDRSNSHNRMKKNRLCGFLIYNNMDKLLLDYPDFMDFPYFEKPKKPGKPNNPSLFIECCQSLQEGFHAPFIVGLSSAYLRLVVSEW